METKYKKERQREKKIIFIMHREGEIECPVDIDVVQNPIVVI